MPSRSKRSVSTKIDEDVLAAARAPARGAAAVAAGLASGHRGRGSRASTLASPPTQLSSIPLPGISVAPGWTSVLRVVAVGAAEERRVAVVIAVDAACAGWPTSRGADVRALGDRGRASSPTACRAARAAGSATRDRGPTAASDAARRDRARARAPSGPYATSAITIATTGRSAGTNSDAEVERLVVEPAEDDEQPGRDRREPPRRRRAAPRATAGRSPGSAR